jgi:hypothetical protein
MANEKPIGTGRNGTVNKGGYPAGGKPASQIKPPPATVTKPAPNVKTK